MSGVSTHEDLLERFAQRDRWALARILTLVERGQAPPLLSATSPANSTQCKPLVVGITGSAGTGKSTLIGTLIRELRRRGLSVAVLANDPQSPRTGGALLGDRIRTSMDPQDEGVYFRSLSTRGAPGGISAATGQAIAWLAAFSFDVVLVETVGVGQDQVAVRPLVDRLVLLVTPMTGDEVQWQKAGLIELADIVVVNKCDLAGAAGVQAELATMLALTQESPTPKVLGVTAATGEGVAKLLDELLRF